MSVRAALLTLFEARDPAATVCPSEVARALARMRGQPESWRDAMPEVHAAVDEMVRDGSVRLTWKGERLATRAGPYRLNRALGS
ncbi:hypothetical protein BZG35_05230 [Brevundimonas sp. LM2]|uniref:DUF3253 domain-containing protein n=1 Tax=Brevundimonas sp. LM2 TaxID=1938605 RepID=UPI000983DA63|nr:DUF3253 domain-containing protein [Brevundimonas sp. LM2]AQR61124.1 hypothetical protein BZG35_05230 [Brevundimonas sp. LM2]